MAMFQSTFLLSLLGYERSHAIDRKSDDDGFVLYIIYKLNDVMPQNAASGELFRWNFLVIFRHQRRFDVRIPQRTVLIFSMNQRNIFKVFDLVID